jgi:hypothetical protein
VPQKKKELEVKRGKMPDWLNGYYTFSGLRDFETYANIVGVFKLRKFARIYITHIKRIRFFTQICYDGFI